MKNQYFGDIGDYGKYGLLRFLASCGITIAINWYLTPNDQSNDGSIRSYLGKQKERCFDPVLFDALKEMNTRGEKDVNLFAARGLISNAFYFDRLVEPISSNMTAAAKRSARERWHQEALEACDGYDLVFLDPDNGLKAGKPTAKKDAVKYAYASEAADYYLHGQNIVYYCHKGRRTDVQWEKAKQIMKDCCPDATMMGVTFHRGTQRSYIFVIHPEQEDRYRTLVRDFLETDWNKCFTDEVIN